jgi:hypothetical protein
MADLFTVSSLALYVDCNPLDGIAYITGPTLSYKAKADRVLAE